MTDRPARSVSEEKKCRQQTADRKNMCATNFFFRDDQLHKCWPLFADLIFGYINSFFVGWLVGAYIVLIANRNTKQTNVDDIKNR